jgi:hypothetical protein
LEELGDFFEAGVCILLLLLGLFDVVQEEPISLVIYLLGGTLRLALDKALESVDPVYFLFGHSNYNIIITDAHHVYAIILEVNSHRIWELFKVTLQ